MVPSFGMFILFLLGGRGKYDCVADLESFEAEMG